MATALQIVKRFYPDVTTVVDSKRSIKVEVTKADAHKSAVKNHNDCALAVACRRSMGDVDGVIICVKTSYLIKGTKAIRFTNPESVSREVTSFDRDAGFEPGTYHLSKVSPSNALGTIRRYKKRKNDKPEPINYHRTENVRILE